MKIIKEPPKFAPITIVLETQNEFDLFLEDLSFLYASDAGHKLTDDLFKELSKHAKK